MSKFNDRTRTVILDRLGDGMAYDEAAAVAGIAANTFAKWRRDGRKASEGEKHEFVKKCDELRGVTARNVAAEKLAAAEDEDTTLGTMEDLQAVTWKTAKNGSVMAQRLYYEMIKPQQADPVAKDPFAALDGPVIDARKRRAL